MARGIPVDIGTRSFANQKEATLFFKDLLSRYAPGDTVGDEDSLHLSALLERHDEYTRKVGCGVHHFEVMMTEHGTPCFRIVRNDASGTDFSYRHCITQRPPSRKQEVSQAFRRAVRFDLFKARDAFFTEHKDEQGLVTCAVLGELISIDQGHMDHRAPMTFEVLVSTFLQGKGLSVDDVPISSGTDEQVAPEITDKELAEAFRKYHSKLAHLDFVRDKANLALGPKNRLKPGRIKINSN